jgi:hypothetical protein
MHHSDLQYASERIAQLKSDFEVDIEKDWGEESGSWKAGFWEKEELDRLHSTLACLADCIGGPQKLRECTGGVTVRKADIGSHGGEALHRRVAFSTKQTFSAWTVVHEFAHSWDANFGWGLARALEKYTGGFTSRALSLAKRLAGRSDSALFGEENKPGRHGRLPGCNAAGYFYGDKPSGSNWKFNRLEDFAESVAMYVGWGRDNDLSAWAEARLDRYLLEDGAQHKYFGIDNWRYYKKYFYPENGEYNKTGRWQFMDDLVNGRVNIQ